MKDEFCTRPGGRVIHGRVWFTTNPTQLAAEAVITREKKRVVIRRRKTLTVRRPQRQD
jgi:hypothetical protein